MARDAPAVVHRLPLRVYWEDTDAGGIVFYANYLKFFERARTEWLRALGVQQQAMRERTGAIFVVTHTSMRFRAPARLDDALQVTVAVRHTGRASLEVAQQAWRVQRPPAAWPPHADEPEPHGNAEPDRETLLVDGDVRIGCVDAASLRPCRIPADILELLP
ncbi:MAG: tol-pal system-associated acyl-CoA thioesterase [Burkholderiales bacterium]|nr:tol-pal system-associated acyl-CoA thioesterase [Burkholderiales bacterium]